MAPPVEIDAASSGRVVGEEVGGCYQARRSPPAMCGLDWPDMATAHCVENIGADRSFGNTWREKAQLLLKAESFETRSFKTRKTRRELEPLRLCARPQLLLSNSCATASTRFAWIGLVRYSFAPRSSARSRSSLAPSVVITTMGS